MYFNTIKGLSPTIIHPVFYCIYSKIHIFGIKCIVLYWITDTSKIGGLKYTKSTVRNQSIIQKSFSSLLHPKSCLMSNQQVLQMVDFWKPVNYISVDLPIFDRVRLNALQTFTTCTPTFWSGKVSTPKKMEWTAAHSKKVGVGGCSLQKFDIFGVEFCALQFFWSGLWVHSKFFGVELKCTPKILEWTWGALQNFWSGLQVHSKFLEWTLSAWLFTSR
jgi:hypothetical protein